MFSLSGKSKNQIPCFPCAVATLWEVIQAGEAIEGEGLFMLEGIIQVGVGHFKLDMDIQAGGGHSRLRGHTC